MTFWRSQRPSGRGLYADHGARRRCHAHLASWELRSANAYVFCLPNVMLPSFFNEHLLAVFEACNNQGAGGTWLSGSRQMRLQRA